MKTIIIIISILFSACVLHSQEYQKMVKEGNKWNYLEESFTTNGAGEARTYSYYVLNDTLIDNVLYKKLMCKTFIHNGSHLNSIGGLREDDALQTIFLKLNNTKAERELYSFNSKVGDTLSVDTTFFKDAYTVRFVKSVDMVELEGIKRKRIEVSDTTYRINNPHIAPNESFHDYWYEGIGSLAHCYFGMEDKNYLELLCAWNNENLIYKNPYQDECVYAYQSLGVKTEEVDRDEVDIFPVSLSKGLFEIRSDQKIATINVFTLNGIFISNQIHGNLIDLCDYPTGVYVVKIETSNGFVVEKIVKY